MNRGPFYYLMTPLLIVAALLQSTAAARFEIRGVRPDLVLILVLIGTLIYGVKPGIVWAFVGGLALDIFSGGPMGASSLALMAGTMVAGLGHNTLSRYNMLVPLGACALGTLAYSFSYLAILAVSDQLQLLEHTLPIQATLESVVAPALLYNSFLMLVAVPFMNRIPESQDI